MNTATTPPSAPAPATGSTPDEPFLRGKYQSLTRKHLGRLLDKLFAEYTGLHFHIAWAPAEAQAWDARTLPTACSVCCRIAGTNLAAQPICQVCGPRQLVRALNAESEGLGFKCRLGVLNYWLPVRVRGVTIGIAYLQTLDGNQPGRTPRQRSARAATKVLSRSEFRRACQLLRLIVQYVQTLDVAELRKTELINAGHAVLALEKEHARLHAALERHLPAPPQVARRSGPETHAEQAVQSLLECVSRKYSRPIRLKDCAAELGMNVAYLSALFSRAVGRPFKTYLTELRMEKARALLSDPAKVVSDVASAVGYASGNRFRIAFKKTTGLAPRVWRETMRVNPPKASPPAA